MRIGIFHATAGHGHKKAAEALYQEALSRGDFKPEDVFIEDTLDSTPEIFRKSYPGLYYFCVKYCPQLWGWFFFLLEEDAIYRFVRPLRSLVNRFYAKKILSRVVESSPDILVSTHFLTAELFATAKSAGKLTSKLVTVVTDFHPHVFWINEGTDLYCVMSEEGKSALLRRGVPPNRIHVTGIPVSFDSSRAIDPKPILQSYGFDEKKLTLLLTSGSFGLGQTELLLEQLESVRHSIQCFVVCGHNTNAYDELKHKSYAYPTKIFGYVQFMAELMSASDLIISKPGGLTTAESLAKGLPMIVSNPIPGQETGNVTVLRDRCAAFVIKDPSEVLGVIELCLKSPELLDQIKQNISKLAKPNAARDILNFAIGEH